MPMVLAMRAPRHPDRPGRRRAGPRLLPGEARRRAGGNLGAARLPRRHGRDPRQEVAGRRPSTATASNTRCTPKGNPSFAGNKMQGWMSNHRALAAAADHDREQVRGRRHQVRRGSHPRARRQRAHPRRDTSVPRRGRRHALVAVLLLRSAAAADAEARRGARRR